MPKTINLNHNELVGNLVFGEGCIINPACSIICQSKNNQCQIIFGDYNIVEEKALILFKPTQTQTIMKIGHYNTFGIKSYVFNSQIGDCNVIQPKAQLKDIKLGNCNIIGSEVPLYKRTFTNNNRVFYPGKFKVIDVFDQQKHKQDIRLIYSTLVK